MKKIWFIGLVLFVAVMLAGCQDSTELAFYLEVVNLDETVLLGEPIIFVEDDTKTIVDLIDETVGLDYSVSEYGVFVNGIGQFYPTEYGITYNYYYALYVDDQMSTVGIQDVELIDGMKISFVETTVLDEIDVEVDRLIQNFISNELEDYINDEIAQYQVLAAYKQLYNYGYDVPGRDSSLLNLSEFPYHRDTIANAFKTIIFEKTFDLSTDDTKAALLSFTADNPYDAVSLLNALSMTDGLTTQIDELLISLTSTTPTFMDADYAGMLLLALAPYGDNEDVISMTVDMLDYIADTLTADGIESWGNSNSSSTAAVILGLVAQGINPRSDDYKTEETDLIEAILKYQVDGTFKYLLADQDPDLLFSTPQVFASLVAYKIFRDVYGNPAFNLFDF